MADTDSTTPSALRENINRKGNNSYYYAHGTKIDGPVWDGKEEPRLLHKTSVDSVSGSDSRKKITITDYAWMDEKASVKIYVEFANAESVGDARITLVSANFEPILLQF